MSNLSGEITKKFAKTSIILSGNRFLVTIRLRFEERQIDPPEKNFSIFLSLDLFVGKTFNFKKKIWMMVSSKIEDHQYCLTFVPGVAWPKMIGVDCTLIYIV